MTVNRTTLLDLPLPVTGTESGTWGDTTNNGLSQYMDIAIAGMNSLTSANFTAGALTIANTQGDSSATNIAAGSAQYATIKVSSLAVNSTITAPSSNRSYRIINADATYSLTIKASGQTGVTFLPGQTGVVAFNGTDYVIVGVVGAGTATDNAVARFDGTTGEIIQNSGVTIDDSNNVSGIAQLNITTLDATNIEVTNIKAKDGTAAASIADSTGVISITSNPVLSGGTANGVLYLNGSKVATSGSALTFDGSKLGVGGNPASTGLDTGVTQAFIVAPNSNTGAAATFIADSVGRGVLVADQAKTTIASISVSSGVVGFGANSNTPVIFNVNASEQMRLTSTGLGIGTSSPGAKLHVSSASDDILRLTATAPYLSFYNGSTRTGYIRANTAGVFGIVSEDASTPMAFYTAGAEVMRLSTSGNLGLGVTPSGWSGFKAFDIGVNGSLASDGGGLFLPNNAYDSTGSGGWKYKISASTPATLYLQTVNGEHRFYNAPSGTAGNAITFTQAMTLDASSRLMVGTTTPDTISGGLTVACSASGTDNTQPYNNEMFAIKNTDRTTNNLTVMYFDGLSSGGSIRGLGAIGMKTTSWTDGAINSDMIFWTSGSGTVTERARITSGGILYVNSTDNGLTSALKLSVTGATGEGAFLFKNDAGASQWTGWIWNTATSGDNLFVNFLTEGGTGTNRGSITYNRAGGLVAYNTTSDYRAKDIIGPVTNSGEVIDSLKVYEGKMKGATQSRPMLVAHEAQEHAPYAVSGVKDEINEDGTFKFQQMDVSSLVPLLLAEIQSLRQRVALLEGN